MLGQKQLFRQLVAISERLLLAESCPSIPANFHDLNVRFGEKRTFRGSLNRLVVLTLNTRT